MHALISVVGLALNIKYKELSTRDMMTLGRKNRSGSPSMTGSPSLLNAVTRRHHYDR